MQQSGGLLLPPVQTLVATLIFAIGKNANESLTHPAALPSLKNPDAFASGIFYGVGGIRKAGEPVIHSYTAGHPAICLDSLQ